MAASLMRRVGAVSFGPRRRTLQGSMPMHNKQDVYVTLADLTAARAKDRLIGPPRNQ